MESRIKSLLEKYWQGDTSVEEEKRIKDYFKNNPDQTPEGLYFEKIKSDKSSFPQKSFEHPGRKINRVWLSAAAAVFILLISLPFIFNNQKQQPDQFAVDDPAKALEITRTSLQMVSNGLNKGKTYSNELVKFNEAKSIIKNQ
jgi:hypothetical protein